MKNVISDYLIPCVMVTAQNIINGNFEIENSVQLLYYFKFILKNKIPGILKDTVD